MSDHRRAVFMDRDGVIIENRADYVRSWDHVSILPGAVEALARLAATGFAVVLVTNQSSIGRGLMTAAAVEAINRRLQGVIEAGGGRIDAIYTCPHRPDDGCACRKPAPGMLLQAAGDLGLSLPGSYMVGDAISDIQAGQAAGATAILVLSGRGRAQLETPRPAGVRPFHIVPDLGEAVALILALEAASGWPQREA